MDTENIKPKVKMPMIPLRDVVIFPNTVSTLFVGREKSIFSLEDALRSNKKIFLIAQNSPSNEEPTIKDLPKIGTLSTLLQMIQYASKLELIYIFMAINGLCLWDI